MASADTDLLEPPDLYLDLPPDRFYPFLLSVAAPALEELRRSGALRDWYFSRVGKLPPSQERWITLRLRPKRGGSKEPLRARVRALLEEPLRAAGGEFRAHEDLQRPAVPPGDWTQRMGGERGARIHRLFMRRSNALVLDLRRAIALPGPSSPGLTGTALAAIFFYLQVFELSARETAAGLAAWVPFFGHAIYASETGTAAARAWVQEERVKPGGGLTALLREPMREDWRAAPEPLRQVFSRHERVMRRIGRLLRSNGPHFHPHRPFELVVFQSYVHLHNIRLGLESPQELLLYALLEAPQSGPAPK